MDNLEKLRQLVDEVEKQRLDTLREIEKILATLKRISDSDRDHSDDN